MKVLHIVPDDKFIDAAISVFDTIGILENIYICPIDENQEFNCQFEFIRRSDCVKKVTYADMRELSQSPDVDMIAFHTLPGSLYESVLQIPSIKKIWWLSWGYDIYYDMSGLGNFPIISLDLYKPLTKEYFTPQLSFRHRIIYCVKKLFKIFINYNGNLEREVRRRQKIKEFKLMRKRVLARINYISTVLPIEYEMLSKTKLIKAKYIPFQYPLKTQNTMWHMEPDASCILVGNSSDSSNNHLDILEIIRQRSIPNLVYMPLTYGDSGYKKYLNEHIKDYNQLLIQDSFISMDEYVKMLTKCRVAIFGHMRQQALGNIGIAMQIGMKVFFYKDSICYKYFKKNGYAVYSIEHDLSNETVNQPLPSELVEINRSKINEMFLYENVRLSLSKFFKENFTDMHA